MINIVLSIIQSSNDGMRLIIHLLNDLSKLATLIGHIIHQNDISKFEISSGSIRCITLNIHTA